MSDMFKVIIAGTRTFNNYQFLKSKCDAILKNKKNIQIVSGCAKGADKLGEVYAEENAYSVAEFPADWSIGNNAGYIRNLQMGNYADALIAFWDGESKGTRMMIEIANNLELPVRVIKI